MVLFGEVCNPDFLFPLFKEIVQGFDGDTRKGPLIFDGYHLEGFVGIGIDAQEHPPFLNGFGAWFFHNPTLAAAFSVNISPSLI